MNDLRFAFRQIAKAPGFTATIVVTLALSIGACTAIYSALDSIVVNPFDDSATKRNVYLRSVKLPDRVDGGLSHPDFLDLEKQATSFEVMVHHSPGDVNLTGTGEPLRLIRMVTTPGYFDVFGIKMALGRGFQPGEFVLGKNNVIVLSYSFWQRTFGGAPDILGRTLRINDEPCTVVGVISERFERTWGFIEIYSPRAADAPPASKSRDPRSSRSITAFTTARLRRGVSIKQAQAELDIIAAALAEKYPETNRNFGMLADPIIPALRGVVPMVKILFGAVGCLMVIACVNVASLLLVRANERQREMSVRAALGATRGRMIQQLLTENILVALIGGAAGIVLAQWALDFIGASVPQGRTSLVAAGGMGLARLSHLELDGGMLAFALGLTLTTALVFGLAPAWLSSSPDLNEALKQGTRGSTEGRTRGRFRATLVVVEIAMAVTLLGCGGLLIRSFLKTAGYQPGFSPKGTAFVRLESLSGKNYEKPEQRFAFIRSLLARIQSAAGVEAVGTTTHFPLSRRTPASSFEIEGGPAMAITERPLAQSFSVSPDYFRAMGIPLRRGRYFSDHDDANSRRVAIINQTFAQRHFPNQDPIGKRIMVANASDRWCEIVGIVGDVAQEEVGEVPSAQLYEAQAQTGNFGVIVVRGHGDPAELLALVKRQVQALDPNLPVGDMSTVETFLHDKIMTRRLMMHLVIAFGMIGLFIAAIGIYGVMAFSVNQRTVEIGIRMALGAQPQDVLRLVLRQGAWLVSIGFVVGIVATFIAGRTLESHLYDTSGSDPLALVSITVFFAAVAALACWLPARRATKVDPIVALRAE